MKEKIDFSTTTEETLKKMGYDSLTFRREYIKQLVGGIYDCGGGVIRIEFPDHSYKILRTKNLAKRLDNIFYQLMAPRHINCNDTWVGKLKAERGPLNFEEILKLKIQVRKDDGKIYRN